MNFFSVFAAGVGIEFLGVLAGAERGQRDGLGFAAGENGRAMRARQEADFAEMGRTVSMSRPSRRLPWSRIKRADVFLLDVIEGVLEDEFGDFFRAEFLHELRADFLDDGVDRAFALEFAGRESAGTMRSPASVLASFRISSGTMFTVISRFFLPACAASSFCASISGWQHSWPNFSAALKSASEISLAEPSYMTMSCGVADVNEVQVAFGISAWVGLATNLPSTRPTRSAPSGPSHGMSLTDSAPKRR